MGALCAIRDKDPFTKSLVVSQFTSFLDLIEEALHKEDFNFVRLDGKMIQETRARAIESFANTCSSSPTVFLLSLTAGGVGLNLTAATRVFLMDPVCSNTFKPFYYIKLFSCIHCSDNIWSN